jgi:RNA polymerase sigma-70 factor (ECF subfamily)
VAADRRLLDELIEAHHAALYRYAWRLCGQASDAEDLVQQTFVMACRKLDQVREPEHARAWLYAVLRSCFLKSCRRQRPVAAGGLELNLNEVPEVSSPPREIESDELQAALGQLSPEYRLVVAMFYFEHASYKEIAERLEVPIGTVMSRLARGKERLRKLLTDKSSLPEPRNSERRLRNEGQSLV